MRVALPLIKKPILTRSTFRTPLASSQHVGIQRILVKGSPSPSTGTRRQFEMRRYHEGNHSRVDTHARSGGAHYAEEQGAFVRDVLDRIGDKWSCW